MSTHYLIDPFTPSQDIIDVSSPESGETDTTGALLIRIPDGAAIRGAPADLTGLLAAKEDGLLAFYAGFTSIVSDSCLTASGLSLASSSRILVGSGVANHCILNGGSLVTSSVTLGSTPGQCVVVWEAYSFDNVDPRAGRFSRRYVEQDSNLLTCSLSFGAGSNPALSGTVLNIPVANQGSSVVLTFQNLSGSRLYLGGWAVIY